MAEADEAGGRKPAWLKVPLAGGSGPVRRALTKGGLHTVCEEARCPNRVECWESGTATFLLMGDACTRGCAFCAVERCATPAPPDQCEPAAVARAAAELGLKYVVLTSVTRDDLPDQGASHYAATIRALHALSPAPLVEVLIPDYLGADLQTVLEARPSVLAHNLEVVARLTPLLRHRSFSYERSLRVLAEARGVPTKSSLLLGLGETEAEVLAAMADLRSVGVEFLVLCQYLQATPAGAAVVDYLSPERFEALARRGRAMGFSEVLAGPLVRTSYRAAETYAARRIEARPRVRLEVLAGLTPYAQARERQLELVALRRKRSVPDTLLLLEHPPVITLGRNAPEAGVLAPPALLQSLDVAVHRIERGGQATLHAPGQLVAYPILGLPDLKLGVTRYVHKLEEVMIRTAAAFGVTAARRPGVVGVFAGQGKLGAIGVRVTGGVSFHGLAFNVSTDLALFGLIVPCGMAQTPAVSLASLTGRAPEMVEVQRVLSGVFAEVMGVELTEGVKTTREW